MSRRIAIIGAGWYGCHIAVTLQSLGFEITVFDSNSRPLDGASGNNQFRLHSGFHYPRHHGTRQQSREGFQRFIERYPTLSSVVRENIYAVPEFESLIDFATYRMIMTASGIEFSEISKCSIDIQNIQGMLAVKERVLCITRARTYFSEALGTVLKLNRRIKCIETQDDKVFVDGEEFEYAIDATWGHLTPPNIPVYYEPTIILYYYAKEEFPAVTFVDGDLCSIYPTEDPNIYTLSSVIHTPLGRCESAAHAQVIKYGVTGQDLAMKMEKMEAQISRYIPAFREHFKYLAPQFGTKTKPIGSSDDRSCSVTRTGNVFKVMSGKIDTIFVSVERILSLLNRSLDETIVDVPSSLMSDIIKDQYYEKS